jgi:hypothetical protein
MMIYDCDSLTQRHTLRKAAAVHDPPPVEDPLAILTRSDEAESGIIQHSFLMF